MGNDVGINLNSFTAISKGYKNESTRDIYSPCTRQPGIRGGSWVQLGNQVCGSGGQLIF